MRPSTRPLAALPAGLVVVLVLVSVTAPPCLACNLITCLAVLGLLVLIAWAWVGVKPG